MGKQTGQRRKGDSGSMAPTSTWKCVALFVNNITCPTRVVGSLIGGGAAKDGSLVPSAVNSLAWSSVEGRLFTGDTDGVVKVSHVNAGRVGVPGGLFFSHTSTFQFLDKPWSQVSSLLPPGFAFIFYRTERRGFSNPTARRFFIECC